MGDTQREKLYDYLKRVTAFSVIDSGVALALEGGITESAKNANRVQGIARENDEESHQVSLSILSGNRIQAACSCCSVEEMQEQWCRHAVALLWTSYDLGFLDSSSGFANSDSLLRMNLSSPEQIATVVRDVGNLEYVKQAVSTWHPTVSIFVDTSSDRLGVQVSFDDEVQTPSIFEGYQRRSARALDNLLLQILDDEGAWDDSHAMWRIGSSKGIELVIGILSEYAEVTTTESGALSFPREKLDAVLQISWQTSSAEVSMHWVLPSGERREKESDLLGTGPYWVNVDNALFQISHSAARICSVFPYGSSVTIPRGQVGPLLETIRDGIFASPFIRIVDPQLQPECEVHDPIPNLSMGSTDSQSEHFTSSHSFTISAALEFDYPSPPKNSNVVFLPNREREREYLEHLLSLGFRQLKSGGQFTAEGDAALDIAHAGAPLFPKPWKVTGLDRIRERVRFTDLQMNVSISSAAEKGKKSSPNEWFDCHISLTQNNANLPISSLFKASRAASDRWIRLDSGAYSRVPGGSLNYLKTTLGLVDPQYKISNSIKTKLRTPQAINLARIDDDSFAISLDKTVRQIETKLRQFDSITPLKPSTAFKGKLRAYQEEGLSWLGFLEDYELGGILADEMGLGKTVQSLALIQLLKEKYKKQKKKVLPSLIVAPTSVITNWCYETKRFAPNLSILLLHGPLRKAVFKDIPDFDVVITSYALLRLDRSELERHEFDLLLVDEAQNIKNPQAAITKAAKAMRAKRRFALTGTPTENRPLELWSIMDFVMPGYLGTEEFFKSYIEKPILEGGPTVQVTRFLQSKTRPFILRRTKAEVEKDLPPKVESVLHVEMATSQAQLYAQVLEEVRPKVLDAIESKGVRGASVSILAALLRLRQICNHPNSIEALKDLQGFDSGKFNLLKELVEEAIQNGRKILLFCQFREMLSLIKGWLEEQQYEHLYLDGSTRNRQELIDQFNSDPNVRLFLISLKAGGTGLNLTAADTVIIYDPWWNPAVESQAVDRAHRIGQTKTVSVYRLVTENSIEQKIMDLKDRKSKIVDALLNDQGLSALKLSKADIEKLFEPMAGTPA